MRVRVQGGWFQSQTPVMSADLTGLHVDVSVTVVGDACAPDAVGHWDGTYWYGDGA